MTNATVSRKTETLEARVTALRNRHTKLDEDIRFEQNRPLPSMGRLRVLKSRKLMLKDEMAYYNGVLQTLSSLDQPPIGVA
jgi:hypothetical protein